MRWQACVSLLHDGRPSSVAGCLMLMTRAIIPLIRRSSVWLIWNHKFQGKLHGISHGIFKQVWYIEAWTEFTIQGQRVRSGRKYHRSPGVISAHAPPATLEQKKHALRRRILVAAEASSHDYPCIHHLPPPDPPHTTRKQSLCKVRKDRHGSVN